MTKWCNIPDDWKLICWKHCYVLNKIWFQWVCEGDYDILRKTTKNNNVIKWGFHSAIKSSTFWLRCLFLIIIIYLHCKLVFYPVAVVLQ
jgi:hypothetical protein